MKSSIAQLVAQAIQGLPELDVNDGDITVERTRDSKHGDFASNIAMRLAKSARKNPRELAQLIIDHLPESD